MRIEVYEVSTVLGLCTVLAALDRFEARPDTKRILIVSINSRHPEVESWYRGSSKIQEAARHRFDRVIELNDEIFPIHPSRWRFERSWLADRHRWLDIIGAERVDVLYLESIQAPPSWSLAQLLAESEIRVYSDGLMVYSPTRNGLPKSVLRRITELIYIDYLGGVSPLMLEEAGVQQTAIPIDELRPHFLAIRPSLPESNTGTATPKALFLGQAMANAGMMKSDDEAALYVRGLTELSRLFGAANIGFKPHTSAPSSLTVRVRRDFRAVTGLDLRIFDGQVPIESLLDTDRTCVIAGVFSTALFTLGQLYGIPAFTYGTKDVIYGLQPYQNSNRIPLIAADILLPNIRALLNACGPAPDEETVKATARSLALAARGNTEEFRTAQLIVGYYMQPGALAHRKAEVERLLASSRVRYLDLYLVGRNDGTRPDSGFRSRVVKETAQWIARIALGERKACKLGKDPDRFFRDSRVPGATLAGRAYRRLIR